tara:strand:+ start:54 stop:263 length:210 start_codon:yes stop_codon:yes gene_type:complete
MKSLFLLIKNIKNLLPYLVIIGIYFFFVNIEARKEKNNELEKQSSINRKQPGLNKNYLKIKIPVTPYEK